MKYTCKKCGAQLYTISPIFQCEMCGHINKPISYKMAYRLLLKKYDYLQKDFDKVFADLSKTRDILFNTNLSLMIVSLILLISLVVSIFI